MTKQEWLRKPLSKEERLGILKRQKRFLDKEIKKLDNNCRGKTVKEVFKDSLEEMTLEEIEQFQNDLKEFVKAKKAQDKELVKAQFQNEAEEGKTASFVFKGVAREGVIVKINEKSFTAQFELDGEMVKKAIQFHLYRGLA